MVLLLEYRSSNANWRQAEDYLNDIWELSPNVTVGKSGLDYKNTNK